MPPCVCLPSLKAVVDHACAVLPASGCDLTRERAVYKLEQIRLDEVKSHYYRLRADFERRQRRGGAGMWRTRQWIQELFRPLLAANVRTPPPALRDVNGVAGGVSRLTAAQLSFLFLDSHCCKLAAVVEGFLLTLFHSRSLVGVAHMALDRVTDPVIDDSGIPDLATLPFPETMVADADDLLGVQARVQAIAMVNALSVTIGRVWCTGDVVDIMSCLEFTGKRIGWLAISASYITLRATCFMQMVLQSPSISDETFAYVRQPNEHELIAKVLNTAHVRRMQQKLYQVVTTAESFEDARQAVIAGVAELMARHHKMLAHDEVRTVM